MIDPTKITNYNRTEAELEEFLLFCIMVAGKNAKQTAKKLDEFLFGTLGIISPFNWVLSMVDIGKVSENFPLECAMKRHKLGQYKRLEKAFTGILQFKNRLKEVSVEELESVHGISSKTSRFFLLHSRPNQRIVVLDTHLLAHMREDLGIVAPKATPDRKKYLELEQKLLEVIDESGKTFAEYDLYVWKSRSQKTYHLLNNFQMPIMVVG
jgi:thermostable 8-oxoguanine DNA glycosylase